MAQRRPATITALAIPAHEVEKEEKGVKARILTALLTVVLLPCVVVAQPSKMVRQPQNVILIVGDGMGVAQVYSSVVAQGDSSAFFRFPITGFSRTYSYNRYTTDSGAGGTALMTGYKVENQHIAFGPNGEWYKSFLSRAKAEKGMKAGFVVTSSVLDATPAATYAHASYRKAFDTISMHMAQCGFDVMIGGDRDHFLPANRKDGKAPLDTLRKAGYTLVFDTAALAKAKAAPLCALLTDGNPPAAPQRGDMLRRGVDYALRTLPNKRGFVLMVEGSQIDWAAHDNDTAHLAAEMVDFEEVLRQVLDFAAKDGNTLVVVTADHETGGLSLLNGSIAEGTNRMHFATGSHSGVMVPVFAYGPGAELFSGIQQNTDIARKIMRLLQIEP